MNVELKRQKGSMSLTALASITGGILFTLLFANLVRYVSVQNALEQATQKIARCIDPTDPECATVSAEPPPLQYDWYVGRRATTQTAWADRYNYRGSLYRQRWVLRFPGYELHRVPPPPVEWTEWQVPLRTFRASLNNFERRLVHLRARFEPPGEVYRPRNEPNFPEFDPTYERIHRDRPTADWSPRVLTVRGDVRLRPGTSVSRSIALPANIYDSPSKVLSDRSNNPNPETAEFVSDFYEVPDLRIQNSGTAICRGENGSSCDISYASGTNNPWQQYASISVKAFATINEIAGSPEIKWAGSPQTMPGTPDGWGLQVETVNRARYSAWKTEAERARLEGRPTPVLEESDFECLGGRDWSELPTNGTAKNFHLVLRGVIKRDSRDNSYDNDPDVDAACPRKDRTHWGLAVERGGAYRIRGYLKVRGGTARASVRFWSYFDDYERAPGSDAIECAGTFPLTRPNETVSGCPYADACPVEAARIESSYRLTSCDVRTERVPLCLPAEEAEFDQTAFSLGTAPACDFATQPACSEDELPSRAPACATEPGRIVCPWTTNGHSTDSIRVPEQATECPLASPITRSEPCGDDRTEVTYRPDGTYGNPAACPAAVRASAALADGTARSSGRFSANFPAYSWGPHSEYTPQKWVPSVFPTDETGQTISGGESIRSTELQLENRTPLYEHSSGFEPTWNVFGLNPAEAAAVRERSHSVSVVQTVEEPIVTGYPFANQPEYEIPEGLPVPGASHCSTVPVPLDERLRAYAAAVHPEAADPDVRFVSSAEYADSVRVTSSGGCDSTQQISLAVPPCTKVSMSSGGDQICDPTEYLGRYSAREHPKGPAACATGALHCVRETVVDNVSESAPQTTVNIELAAARGFAEIERSFPGTKRDCSTSGCFQAEIDAVSSPRTSITTRYRMPLTFPLNVITGNDFINVEKTKSELREIEAVGRVRADLSEERK